MNVEEKLDVTDSAGVKGSFGRDVILQKLQWGKGSLGRDVILLSVQG